MRRLDDFIIDRVFQKIADALHRHASCYAIASFLLTGYGLIGIVALVAGGESEQRQASGGGTCHRAAPSGVVYERRSQANLAGRSPRGGDSPHREAIRGHPARFCRRNYLPPPLQAATGSVAASVRLGAGGRTRDNRTPAVAFMPL